MVKMYHTWKNSVTEYLRLLKKNRFRLGKEKSIGTPNIKYLTTENCVNFVKEDKKKVKSFTEKNKRNWYFS